MAPSDEDRRPKRTTNLWNFHKPRLRLYESPDHVLTKESKRCLRNLANYRTPPKSIRFPRSRSAAVLVALFIGRHGDLYVLLSRRSSTLRTYAGDTSLPGGKVEDDDKTIEDTARREAYEEIGLPIDKAKVPLLCVLEPFLAGNQLIVTPVVVLILDETLKPVLNKDEVASLFSHPLASFLTEALPFPSEPEAVEVEYHTSVDIPWRDMGDVRMHQFMTGREAGGTKPVYGLTAAMCIRVATIGYAREPQFEVDVPGGPTIEERIAYDLLHHPTFKKACVEEGINPEIAVGSFLRRVRDLTKGEAARKRRRRERWPRNKL